MARLIAIEDLVGPSVGGRGGFAMHVLHVLEAMRRLGHEVLFLEFLQERPRPQVSESFTAILGERRGALLDASTGESFAGLSRDAVASFAQRADAMISLAANYRREPWPLLERVRPRILIEQDPGYTHLWAAEGDPRDIFGEHDFYFTVGANVGTARSMIPTCGIDWRPLWPPVVLDWWAGPVPLERDRFTTVASWRDYGYLEFGGQILGPKVEEFRKFIDLPRAAGEQLELTLEIDRDDPDRALLLDHDWRLEDPSIVNTPDRFRAYVTGSLGEFSCAKGGYVGTRSGWFSDRSVCYLAAGRPVVLQATGFEDSLPVGEGAFAVRDIDAASAAIAEIRGDYERHSHAARQLAREFFDAQVLMRRMLEASGIS
jgi:glycosyltransferase involved in cell wall biosynthesis